VLTTRFIFPAFQCECGNSFSRRDNLFQHMRAKGCVVWYKDGIRQREMTKYAKNRDTKNCKRGEDADDLYVEQVMADAEIAQTKRDRACKQAWSRS